MQNPEILNSKDGLTGFHTKEGLYEYLSTKTASVYSRAFKLAVILLDLDNFKGINDNFGHLIGDDALRHFSLAINKALKGRHFIARYGGDEFVIAMEDTADGKGSSEITKRIKAILKKEKFFTPKGSININASIGIAIYPDDSKTSRGLLEVADQALYYAKAHGKNLVITSKALKKHTSRAKVFGLIKLLVIANILIFVILAYRSTNSMRGVIDYYHNASQYISYRINKHKTKYDFASVTLRDGKMIEGWIVKEDLENLSLILSEPTFHMNPKKFKHFSQPVVIPKATIKHSVNTLHP